VLKDPSQLANLIENIIPDRAETYKCDQQLSINLCAELEESQKDNSDYASGIADLEHALASGNTTIHISQATANYTTLPMVKPIELPHPPEFSGDRKELLNVISKVR
jgi:hypothetical protein